MAESGVTEDEVRRVVAAKGHFAEDVPIARYGEKFIDGWQIKYWPQIVELIDANNRDRTEKREDILTMRDQENTHDTDSLYALFTGIDAARIKTVRDALRAEQWHFLKPKECLSFLQEYLPEEAFRTYDGLFSDFRMGGYRVLGDIICDIDDDNRQADKAKLHYYLANKPADSDWCVLPVTNVEAYLGSSALSRMYLKELKDTFMVRKESASVVGAYKNGRWQSCGKPLIPELKQLPSGSSESIVFTYVRT